MSTPREGWNDLIFMLRLGDAPPVNYRRKNILWATPLPDHSHGAPVIVGDRVFVTSEPDELIAIDKRTGEILWSATNNYYDATPQAERDANPAFREKIEPLAKRLHAEKDPAQRWAARKSLYDALQEIDKKKYTMNFDGHLQGHFEIVGFTNTPASDGKYVYFWNGAGVAACYDLDGRRQWIRRLEAKKLFYSAAPAVIGGKLAVYFSRMYGLDARTGRIAWEQPEVNKTVASLLSARLAGVEVFISQQGEVVRASDGKMLWKNPQQDHQRHRLGPAHRAGQRDVPPLVRRAAALRPRLRRLHGRPVEAQGRHRGASARPCPPCPRAVRGNLSQPDGRLAADLRREKPTSTISAAAITWST